MAMSVYSTHKANEGSVNNYSRDASFSSYLDTAEKDFVRNLSASIHSPSPAREVSTTPRASTGKINRILRSELDVFGAEKYFNESLEEKKSSITRKDGVLRDKQRHRRARRDNQLEKKSTRSNTTTTSTNTTSRSFKSPTPSLKSQGSYNRQLISLPKAVVGLKILSGFQCKGTCFDKKSVYTINTKEIVQSPPKSYQENVPRKNSLSHQEHFAFPIIDTASYKHLEDQPRKSLQVFGFHHIGKQDIANNLERKLSILAWDAIPNSTSIPLPFPFHSTKTSSNASIRAEDHLDARSDASSDLFEIENLSGVPPSQTSCAPSEASIQWSAVTASAAEFSMVSDFHDDDKIVTPLQTSNKFITMDKNKMRRSPSSNGGLLLGCKSHKSVDVVGSFTNSNRNVPRLSKVDH